MPPRRSCHHPAQTNTSVLIAYKSGLPQICPHCYSKQRFAQTPLLNSTKQDTFSTISSKHKPSEQVLSSPGERYHIALSVGNMYPKYALSIAH